MAFQLFFGGRRPVANDGFTVFSAGVLVVGCPGVCIHGVPLLEATRLRISLEVWLHLLYVSRTGSVGVRPGLWRSLEGLSSDGWNATPGTLQTWALKLSDPRHAQVRAPFQEPGTDPTGFSSGTFELCRFQRVPYKFPIQRLRGCGQREILHLEVVARVEVAGDWLGAKYSVKLPSVDDYVAESVLFLTVGLLAPFDTGTRSGTCFLFRVTTRAGLG